MELRSLLIFYGSCQVKYGRTEDAETMLRFVKRACICGFGALSLKNCSGKERERMAEKELRKKS